MQSGATTMSRPIYLESIKQAEQIYKGRQTAILLPKKGGDYLLPPRLYRIASPIYTIDGVYPIVIKADYCSRTNLYLTNNNDLVWFLGSNLPEGLRRFCVKLHSINLYRLFDEDGYLYFYSLGFDTEEEMIEYLAQKKTEEYWILGVSYYEVNWKAV